mgnify:CR=1 FL=1
MVEYMIKTTVEEKDTYYFAREYYRLRKGDERIYLLDFSRTMEQAFDPETGDIANNKIVLGIRDKVVTMAESTDGSRLAFVSAGRLFSYNSEENKMAYIFGFYDRENMEDRRETYRSNDIKIFRVDDDGNIYFCVYGYMSGGIHEGDLGAAVYYYDTARNTIEELMFLPYAATYDLLCLEMDKLSYANAAGECFFVLNNTVYQINTVTGTRKILAESVPLGGIRMSGKGQMAVWVEGEDLYHARSLMMLELSSGNLMTLDCEPGERILPIGYFDEDIVYGIANAADVSEDESGHTFFPMKRICIRTIKGEVLKTYEEPDVYITQAVMNDRMITLKRVRREEGEWIEIGDDQIMNNSLSVSEKNTVATAVTDKYETLVQLELRSDIDTKSMQLLAPLLLLPEENRTVEIATDITTAYYYVYEEGILKAEYLYAYEAVQRAYETGAPAVAADGRTIYRKTTRQTKNQIMAIKGDLVAEDAENASEKLACCLETILKYEGVITSVKEDLASGKRATEILEEYLDGADILNLSGCSVDMILYYVAQDIPVMALREDGSAILIIGYNDTQLVIYDPAVSGVAKHSRSEIEKMLLPEGNRFITYIR